MRYQFIILEGGDGTGKTTIAHRLTEHLKTFGKDVVLTREPGGTPGAEEIRTMLLSGDPGKLTPSAELLSFYAARVDHIEQLIAPALESGKIVITDRFDLSTWAFQASAHPELHQTFNWLHQLATAPLKRKGLLARGFCWMFCHILRYIEWAAAAKKRIGWSKLMTILFCIGGMRISTWQKRSFLPMKSWMLPVIPIRCSDASLMHSSYSKPRSPHILRGDLDFF